VPHRMMAVLSLAAATLLEGLAFLSDMVDLGPAAVGSITVAFALMILVGGLLTDAGPAIPTRTPLIPRSS
jgi:hypothetical protein